MVQKNIVTTDHIESKRFAYNKNAVSLNFSLRIDIKQELKDFVEILERALDDVKEEEKLVGKK